MPSLDQKLKRINSERSEVLTKIKKRDANKKIKCASCKKEHRIKDLVLIQTYWRTSPDGHGGGDTLMDGELQFRCPNTSVRNRLLFDNNEVPYEERELYKNNPEAQFKDKYGGLFKAVEEDHNFYDYKELGAKEEPFVNNFYVDKNRKMFGLVEKVEEED